MANCKNFRCKYANNNDTCKFNNKVCQLVYGCMYRADCQSCEKNEDCKDKVTVKLPI